MVIALCDVGCDIFSAERKATTRIIVGIGTSLAIGVGWIGLG